MERLALPTPNATGSIARLRLAHVSHSGEGVRAVKSSSNVFPLSIATLFPRHAEIVTLRAGWLRIASPLKAILMFLARVARCASVMDSFPMESFALNTPNAKRSTASLRLKHVSQSQDLLIPALELL